MVTFLAFIIELGIIGGLACAALRSSAQQHTLLIVGVDKSGRRLAGRMQTPLLGISRCKPEGSPAFQRVPVAAGRYVLGQRCEYQPWRDDAYMA